MHYWIVEHDIFEHRQENHRNKRNEINDRFIGTLDDAPVIVVQGKEIRKPSWFRETTMDLDQMMSQMGNRRNR